MTILEIIIFGYMVNFMLLFIYGLYTLTLVLSSGSVMRIIELNKILEKFASRNNFLMANIKSYKKYNLIMFFPFAMILKMFKLISSSYSYGLYQGFIYILDDTNNRLEILYKKEKENKN